jgi:hypothetical protein
MSALKSWFELVRPGGFLVIVVPDEDLYEQGSWPSRFNSDHKWSFTIKKASSWSPRSLNVMDMAASTLSNFSFVRTTLLDTNYDYAIVGVDQSSAAAETSIEMILRKHNVAAGTAPRQLDLKRLLREGTVAGYSENLSHRLVTIRRAIDLLGQSPRRVFVECGSQTSMQLHSQGISTTIWTAIAQEHGGELYTVDNRPEAISECRRFTSMYRNITYVLNDSVTFLKRFGRTIDFLYLDSLDFYDDCKEEARRHQLAEIEAAYDKLAPGAIVLLDDAHVQMWFADNLDDADAQGPTLLSHNFLLQRGARCICDAPENYQRLYII